MNLHMSVKPLCDDHWFCVPAMLMYRSCRCCRRIWNKLLHTTFHLLAIPCIAMAFIAVYDSHVLNTVPDPQDPEKRLPKPIPDFYSLHSWMGFATMGLFALQVHFPSFLVRITEVHGCLVWESKDRDSRGLSLDSVGFEIYPYL